MNNQNRVVAILALLSVFLGIVALGITSNFVPVIPFASTVMQWLGPVGSIPGMAVLAAIGFILAIVARKMSAGLERGGPWKLIARSGLILSALDFIIAVFLFFTVNR